MASPLSTAQQTALLQLATIEQQFSFLALALMSFQSAANQSQTNAIAQTIQLIPNFNSQLVYVRALLPLIDSAIAQFPTQQIVEIFPGITVPQIVLPAASSVFTVSQNSAYGAPGTYATLTDGNGATGAFTYPSAPPSWIKLTYQFPVIVTAIRVGAGTIAGVGSTVDHLNNHVIQCSDDDMNWTDLVTVTGVTNSGANQFKTFTLSFPVTTKFVRLYSGSDITSCSEFQPL